MTQVIFYVYVAARLPFLHGLLSRKLLPRNLRIHIAAKNEAEAVEIDRYLWTAVAGDFLPHARAEEEAAAESPIIIGIGEPPSDCNADTLVWWQPSPPSNFGQFKYLVEISENGAQQNKAARARYKFYQEHGYNIDLHKIGKNIG